MDLGPSHAGQESASRSIDSTLAIGVKTPNKSRKVMSARATIRHRLTLSVDELWIFKSNSIPIILTRNKNSAAPGNPVGNIEKSRCTPNHMTHVAVPGGSPGLAMISPFGLLVASSTGVSWLELDLRVN